MCPNSYMSYYLYMKYVTYSKYMTYLKQGTGKGGANGSIRFELDRRANYGLSRPLEALRPIQNAAKVTS